MRWKLEPVLDAYPSGLLYNCTAMAAVPIVIDASAVIAVITNEAHKPALIRLTEGAELLSPSSLPIEVGNAFSAMFKRRRISLKQAKAAVEIYQHIAIRLTNIDLARALELSHQLGIYAYDAYLIACSLQYRAALLTLDGGLREAARRAKVEVLEVPT
jgi:predicted nucleic acid-binding protein